MEEQLISFFSEFLTEERLNVILKNSLLRTRYMTVVIENIYQSHNASAVVRTADCLGIQDVHIIENGNKYKLSTDVVLGANKWLSIHQYNSIEDNTLETINKLKAKGYRIVATTPHSNCVTMDEFDIGRGKFALILGTEIAGLSQVVLDNADEFMKVPMVGFTESLNVSASAAIMLYDLSSRLRRSDIDWRLSYNELTTLRLEWLRKSIKSSRLLEKEFYKRKNIL